MPLWKQFVGAALVGAAVLALWIAFVPAAMPVLARFGVLTPLERLGLIAGTEAAAASSAPAQGTGAGGGAGGRPAGGAGAGGPAAGGAGGPVRVVATAPQVRPMQDIVTAIGSARGARSVVVAAEVAGQITALPAGPGQFVAAGSVVAQLDAVAATIARDRAALLLADAQATADRVTALRGSGSATDLQRREAELALATAALQVREADLDLSRRVIRAPIDGWTGIVAVEVGDRVAAGAEVTRLEDRSSLIVDFRVPERVVSRLALDGAVSASPLAEPGVVLEGRISALDNRVDEASRTLLVQAAVPNTEDRLRAGMAFAISLAFRGETLPGVDPLAIQWGADGAFVWVLRDGRAERLAVRIVQRNADAVLIKADFAPGDLVVSEGVQALRPGAEAVAVAVASGAAQDAASGAAQDGASGVAQDGVAQDGASGAAQDGVAQNRASGTPGAQSGAAQGAAGGAPPSAPGTQTPAEGASPLPAGAANPAGKAVAPAPKP